MLPLAKYDILTLDFSEKRISWPADTVKAYFATRTPLPADVTLSDAQPLANNFYSPGTVQSKSVTGAGGIATLRAAPVEVVTIGGSFSVQYVVFANASNSNRLMFWYALPAPVQIQSSTFTIGQPADDGLYDVCSLQ
jgi:hypothetical protein